ncbi:MAG: hypothetical protein M9924_19965 [Rhizobiaceae bacterium]|nr:hypothetical protein [Rhizobiaceae bacterium]
MNRDRSTGDTLLKRDPASANPADQGISRADTVTKIDPLAAGRVVVCGSHGGLYSGYLAVAAGLRAVIFNDAGIGLERAGIASLDYLQRHNMAGAALSHLSCRIGDTQSMLETGVVSAMNDLAGRFGVSEGMACAEAADLLRAASLDLRRPASAQQEARREAPFQGKRRIVLLDSASLVHESDAGQLVVTGSHGGLVGRDPAAALRTDAFVGVFNDAGFGLDDAGAGRLPVLEARAIAAFTVSHMSARIGDASSTYETGVISRVNAQAARLGAMVGMSAKEMLHRLADQ